MHTLRDTAGQQLRWFNMGFSCYKLQGEGETLATVNEEGKLLVAEAEGEQWLFKGSKPFSERVEIYPGEVRHSLDTALPLASFAFCYQEKRQELRFVDGRSFLWTWERSATPALTCLLPNGQKILCVQTLRQRLFDQVEFVLEIDQEARSLREIPLLAFFGLYLGRLVRWYSEHDLQYNRRAWINVFLSLLGAGS